MANGKKEDRRVVFRRIGGRIVPIVVGGGAIYGAGKLNPGKARVKALNKMDVSYSKARQKEIKKFNRARFRSTNVNAQYNHLKQDDRKFQILKRVYKKEIEASFGLKNGKVSNYVKMNRLRPTHFDPNNLFGRVSLNKARTSSLLHELGHAQQYFKKSKLDKLRNKSLNWPSKTYMKTDDIFKKMKLSKIFKKAPKFDRALRYRIREPLVSASYFARELVVTSHEADAWRRGYKMGKTWKMKRRVIKQAVRPLWTYAASPATKLGKIGLVLGGAGLIAKGIFDD